MEGFGLRVGRSGQRDTGQHAIEANDALTPAVVPAATERKEGIERTAVESGVDDRPHTTHR